ncbi:branched-chain amino acid ABC transporter permease [Candidatus Bathyarchaeota archaeon]|nr:branched-chain amino acid ABC transporter permease [Candidatus Bathyarchaeota archaeon]MBS7628450.1 branched-chain amino acid ABC transporter permease [Candidatus Bathyarchaeota archaeon]
MKTKYIIALIIGLLLASVLPLVIPKYYTYVLSVTICFAIYALGYNILFGRTGLLSFGHALYLGIGAYTVAALMRPELGPYRIFSMELLLLAAIVTSAIVGLGVGALCIRYTRIFFGLINLGFVMVWHALLLKLYHITGGTDGLPVYIPSTLGITLPYETFRTFSFYYYVLAVFLIVTYVMWRIYNSPFGLALKAIRENGVRAEFIGIPVGRYRLAAYVISAIYGGIGGALWAPLSGQVSPDVSTWLTSGDVVMMNILGGMFNFAGPIVGAFLFYNLKIQIMHFTTYWSFILGLSAIFFVLVFPGGIMGWLSTKMKKFYGQKA